jgi:hypothetical protein
MKNLGVWLTEILPELKDLIPGMEKLILSQDFG